MKKNAFALVLLLLAVTTYAQDCSDESYRRPLVEVAQDFFGNGLAYYNKTLSAKSSSDWNDWSEALHNDSTSAYMNFLVVQKIGSYSDLIFSRINKYDLQNKVGGVKIVRNDLNSKLKREGMNSSPVELAQELSDSEQQAQSLFDEIINCQ